MVVYLFLKFVASQHLSLIKRSSRQNSEKADIRLGKVGLRPEHHKTPLIKVTLISLRSFSVIGNEWSVITIILLSGSEILLL